MGAPPPLTPLVRFLAGVSYLPGAVLFIVRNPRVWPILIAPVLIGALLLMLGLFLGAFLAAFLQKILFGVAGRDISPWFEFLAVTGLWIGSLGAGGICGIAAGFAILGPLFEKVSEKVEEVSGLSVHRSPGLKWEIIQSLKTAGFFAISAPIAVLLGLVPIVGPLLSLIFTGYRLAFRNCDIALLRRQMSFGDRRAFHSRFRPETLGFGMAGVLLFPVISIFATPIYVVGATRLVADLERVKDEPGEDQTAAILAAPDAPIAGP